MVTTVAQHPMGLDLHLRNLRWALRGCAHEIHVQTFAAWRFQSRDVHWLSQEGDPLSYFLFWDEARRFLEPLLGHASAFLLIEQDMLFTAPIADLVARCAREQTLVVNLETRFLAVHSWDGERVYPRVWEGAVLLPASLLAAAFADGVGLGSRLAAFRTGGPLYRRYQETLEAHCTTKSIPPERELFPLTDLLDPEFSETLLELSLYCFCIQHPWISAREKGLDDHWGDRMVHLGNPETAHRDLPRVYEEITALWELPPGYSPRLNDIAFHYLLTRVHEAGEAMERLLLHPAGLNLLAEKLTRLAPSAAEWMDPEEHARFLWAAQRVRP